MGRWLLTLVVLAMASPASADGLVPRGFTFTYRSLADSNVTTQLVFDAEPSDVEVGVDVTPYTIVGVIRAVWQGGPDHGLEWFFTDSDSVAAESDMLIHGFRRPGLAVAFFEPGTEVPTDSTQTFPQVWSPATLQDGMTWSWTGRGLYADYSQDRTENYLASQDSIEVPYRGEWSSFLIQINEPVPGTFALPDGRALDAYGRLISDGGTSKIAEPRWLTAVSTSAEGRWSILLKDSLVELVDVEFDGDPIVPTQSTSFSNLKSRFR